MHQWNANRLTQILQELCQTVALVVLLAGRFAEVLTGCEGFGDEAQQGTEWSPQQLQCHSCQKIC